MLVVMRILGVGGGSEEVVEVEEEPAAAKRVGNFRARASGARERFVAAEAVERVGEVARAVAERSWDLDGRGFLDGLMASPSESSSGSDSEELEALSMLSLSLSLPSSWCSSVSSSGNACSSSSRCLFSLSTSTLSPRPPSSASS